MYISGTLDLTPLLSIQYSPVEGLCNNLTLLFATVGTTISSSSSLSSVPIGIPVFLISETVGSFSSEESSSASGLFQLSSSSSSLSLSSSSSSPSPSSSS
jgi:hypothetical protein